MATNRESDDSEKRLMVLIEEMSSESDRTVAIVGAAWIEEALGAAIEAHLQPDPVSKKRLFNGAGPLNTFSAKIDLARLLGLTSATIRSDLHTIREIRNDFAHQIAHKTSDDRLSFKLSNISDKCFSLQCVNGERIANSREAFIRACARLNADLQLLAQFGQEPSHVGRVFALGEDEA